MDSLLQDIRYAFRQLLANRSTTIIAILTLALGIGANVTVMSLINATLFKQPPGVNPDELVWITPRQERGGGYGNWSYPNYKDFTAAATSYTGVLTFANLSLSLGGEAPRRVQSLLVSGNYFSVLGIPVAAGRAFTAADDARGAPPVAIVSHALWSSRFGGDSSLLGRTIILNSHPFTVIGVAPKGFAGISMGQVSEVWVPAVSMLQLYPPQQSMYEARNAGWLSVVGRLKTDRARAEAEAQTIAPRFDTDRSADDKRTIVVSPLEGGLDVSNREQAAPILALVMVVPLLVLAVASANVANLFVARGLRRRKELAVRRALGASRSRLTRLLLTECLVLAAIAAVTGMLLSSWLTAFVSRVAAVPADVAPALVPDWRVFVATFALAMIAGALFGLLPSLAASRDALTPALKNESVTLRLGRTRHRLRNTFVVGQVAVSLLLLITAGLFVGSLSKALRVEPGFDPSNTVAVSYDLRAQGYATDKIGAFNQRLQQELSATNGLESAALTNVVPLSGRSMTTNVAREGAGEFERPEASLAAVTPAFFATMRIPIVRGRAFSTDDRAGSARVIILNETLAEQLWPGQDPLGKRVSSGMGGDELREVVGVVRNGKYRSLAETRPVGFYFVPAAQDDMGDEITVVARGTGDTRATIAAITAVFKRMDPNLPLFRAATVEETIAGTVDGQRAGAALLGIFGTLALGLAALGIFGVISQGVVTRTREIGIRMSLGARAGDVVRAFVREGLTLTLVGAVIGVAMSLAVSRLLTDLLFGLAPTDTLTFVSGVAVLVGAAVVASLIPARRAARVEPTIALRAE